MRVNWHRSMHTPRSSRGILLCRSMTRKGAPGQFKPRSPNSPAAATAAAAGSASRSTLGEVDLIAGDQAPMDRLRLREAGRYARYPLAGRDQAPVEPVPKLVLDRRKVRF